MSYAAKLIGARAREVRLAGPDAPEPVPSPCISVCRMDPVTQWCQGCFRTLEEIAAWSRMDDGTKRAVWALIEQRLPLAPTTPQAAP